MIVGYQRPGSIKLSDVIMTVKLISYVIGSENKNIDHYRVILKEHNMKPTTRKMNSYHKATKYITK